MNAMGKAHAAAVHGQTDMEIVDAMRPEHRALVHEYGLQPVLALITHGVTKPNIIRHIIMVVRNAGVDGRPRGGDDQRGARQNRGTALLAALDPWLIAQGAGFTGRQLVQLIRDKSYVVLPQGPSYAMVEASMATVNDGPIITKEAKHFRRLQAALLAGDRAIWGGAGAK